VFDLRGKSVHLEIEDSAVGTYGFIGVDNVRGVTEAELQKFNESRVDFSNLTYQSQVKQMADGWRAKYHLPGVWCTVVKGGKIVACVATGVKNIDSGVPAYITDHVDVGSVSKPITGSLISTLVSMGIVDFDATLAQTFPELAKKYPSSPILGATLRQFLAHIAGLPEAYKMDVSDLKEDGDGVAWRYRGVEQALTSNVTTPPNQIYTYNNAGADIAVAMAERMVQNKGQADKVGRSYEDWLTGPIGLQFGFHTAQMLDWSKTPGAQQVQSHFTSDNGATVNHVPFHSSLRFYTAGSCNITLVDLASFILSSLYNSPGLSKQIYNDITTRVSTDLRSDTSASWHLASGGYLFHEGSRGQGGVACVMVNPKQGTGFAVYVNGDPKGKEAREKANVIGKLTADLHGLLGTFKKGS
jgi:CubicO group peptidase (beta-lactamase class C family)